MILNFLRSTFWLYFNDIWEHSQLVPFCKALGQTTGLAAACQESGSVRLALRNQPFCLTARYIYQKAMIHSGLSVIQVWEPGRHRTFKLRKRTWSLN